MNSRVVTRRCNWDCGNGRSNQRHDALQWKFSWLQRRWVWYRWCSWPHEPIYTIESITEVSNRHTSFYSRAETTPRWYKEVSQTSWRFWRLVNRGHTICIFCICTMVVEQHGRNSTRHLYLAQDMTLHRSRRTILWPTSMKRKQFQNMNGFPTILTCPSGMERIQS